MKEKTEKDEKSCWMCKRIIVGGSKSALCPKCINKYGTGAATFGFAGLVFLGRKYGSKIAKGAINVIKHTK